MCVWECIFFDCTNHTHTKNIAMKQNLWRLKLVRSCMLGSLLNQQTRKLEDSSFWRKKNFFRNGHDQKKVKKNIFYFFFFFFYSCQLDWSGLSFWRCQFLLLQYFFRYPVSETLIPKKSAPIPRKSFGENEKKKVFNQLNGFKRVSAASNGTIQLVLGKRGFFNIHRTSPTCQNRKLGTAFRSKLSHRT